MSLKWRVYKRAVKSASGSSADTIKSVDEEVVVEVDMRER
jgi:hypothetical protein